MEDSNGATYYRSHSGILPLRWCAPEVIESQKFSMASDVWSFGVLLGEIFSDGLRPYNDLSDRQVVDMLNEGARMKRPPNCPDEAYELMRTCFETSPADRPDFATIVTALSCALPDSLEPGSNEIMRA